MPEPPSFVLLKPPPAAGGMPLAPPLTVPPMGPSVPLPPLPLALLLPVLAVPPGALGRPPPPLRFLLPPNPPLLFAIVLILSMSPGLKAPVQRRPGGVARCGVLDYMPGGCG